MIELDVFGDPAPQGSKRVFNGRVVEASGEKLKKWRKAIAAECDKVTGHDILLGPVRVEIDFYLPRPTTVTQKKRALPIVPPDVDKLSRAVLDGVNQGPTGKVGDGLIYADDSQVVELYARKFYADDRHPGATIRISAL